MFWLPAACPYVLPVIAVNQPPTSSGLPFDVDWLPCRTAVLQALDGLWHILLRDEIGGLQLAVSGEGVRSPASLLVDAVWPEAYLKHRLAALECLNALCAGKGFPARLFAPDNRGLRHRFVLRALDGSLAGASHREIAEALMGEERVDDDWNDPGDHLRDRIRRAIRRGRALINGGYLDFLR